MTILPREQVTQRKDATVAAPGVELWSSATNLATCEVVNTNVVVDGEVEDAQLDPPEWFWDVIVNFPPFSESGFGEDFFGEDAFGASQDEPPDGIYHHTDDLDIEWHEPDGLLFWGTGENEDGVYP